MKQENADPDTSSHPASGDDEDQPIHMEDVQELMCELRRMANSLLSGERGAASVCATALVISSLRRYKLSDQGWDEVSWANRSHFFKSAYIMMRRALIDHARKRRARCRPILEGVTTEALDFYHLANTAHHTPDLIIALDEALSWLSAENNGLAVVVQHHYFSGFTVPEIAELMELSDKTIKRRLAESRMVLEKKIRELLLATA